MFWKKKKKEVMITEIPAEHVREICVLFDIYSTVPQGQDRAAKYDLWKRVMELCPEIKEVNDLTLRFESACVIKIIKGSGMV